MDEKRKKAIKGISNASNKFEVTFTRSFTEHIYIYSIYHTN